MRRGFTMTELLVVILIIALISGLALAGLNGATELAREQRTRVVVAKLDQLIGERWESYRTRAVPIQVATRRGYTDPRMAAQTRLSGLRELQRMELPDRKTDVTDPPVLLSINSAPSVWRSYQRMADRRARSKFGSTANWVVKWTEQYQGSECLHLILSSMHDGDKNALDYFSSDEIGDIDDDGMPEILDGWGQPIEFLRWAPGHLTALGAISPLDVTVPDPFDPVKADTRWSDVNATIKPFALMPLILSAGRDKVYDIAILDRFPSGVHNGGPFQYSKTAPLNDPYYGLNSTTGLVLNGTPTDFDGDGISGDNITNLAPETP